ncbi:MAG: hypothetical protein KFF45_06240 [Thioalkalivibrio sp.]|nr:hypothetical protein [Thioalkalivibrio sp.]
MTQQATRLVIVTEKVLTKAVAAIIESYDASGYTLIAAGGMGSHNTRSSGEPSVLDHFGNIKIEVITADPDSAKKIADAVSERYAADYACIIYIDPVEVLYSHRL